MRFDLTAQPENNISEKTVSDFHTELMDTIE
jgi:hypothetical protein